MSHMYDVDGGRYTVYYPCDGSVRKNLPSSSIRPVEQSSTVPKRGDLLDELWDYEGDDELPPGTWKVRRVVGNTYQCTKIRGAGTRNIETFDIGHVIHCWTRDKEARRERGPCV